MRHGSMTLVAALSCPWMAILPYASESAADDLYVDDSNTTGTTNGSLLRPYATIQAALDAASTGDSVLVATGLYSENVTISDKQIALRGGFAGGSSAGYAANQGGDFSAQLPAVNVTTIRAASGVAPAVLVILKGADGSVIDGFTIRDGGHGIEIDESFSFPDVLDGITISRNVLEQNGEALEEHRGGGLLLTGANHVIEDNVIRDNRSGRGAGATVCCTDIIFRRNLVEENIGAGDHGGGLNLFGSAVLSENVVRGNRIGDTLGYGWGGGILISNEGTSATLRNNVFTENHAPGRGGGVFVDEGAEALLDHELIFANAAGQGGGVYVDGNTSGIGSRADIRHCTIAGNIAEDPPFNNDFGNAVYVETNSTATFSNTIVWDNQGDDFAADGTSTITATYTSSQEAIAGTGNFVADPLFANPTAGDYHLRSTGGRFDPNANGGAGGFAIDAQHSPAIDAGNPASDFSAETLPNGGRANLGAYGNTAEASRSAPEPGSVATGAAALAALAETFRRRARQARPSRTS